jgi:hypothetical protein
MMMITTTPLLRRQRMPTEACFNFDPKSNLKTILKNLKKIQFAVRTRASALLDGENTCTNITMYNKPRINTYSLVFIIDYNNNN